MQKNASCCWVGPKLKTKQVNSELFNFNSLLTNAPVDVTSQRRRGWESWDLSFTPMHAQPFDCYFWRVWSFIIILRNFKALDVLDSRTACMAGRAELDRGRRLRAKCKSLSKTTGNYQERQQNNSVENVFQRWFQTKNFYFCMTNTLQRTRNLNRWFQPENSRFSSPWPQLKNVLTCAVAVMLQKYFRLAFVVPRTSGA